MGGTVGRRDLGYCWSIWDGSGVEMEVLKEGQLMVVTEEVNWCTWES